MVTFNDVIRSTEVIVRKVKEVIDFVRQSGGIQYTEQVMLKFRQEAFDVLDTFPSSEARQALRELVVFVTERKK